MIYLVFKEFITFLGTKDLDLTSNFYLNILGLTIYKDQGICRIFNITNESKIGFCTHIPVVTNEKTPLITFITEHVDEVYNNLKELGIEVTKKPEINNKFRIYHFFMKDPNGYTIEIQKFLD